MLLDRLRRDTRTAHDRIERDLALVERPLTIGQYRALLARFYGFYAAWEPAVAPVIADDGFFGPRRKAHLIARDLTALGDGPDSIARLPLCPTLPPLGGMAQAFGSMYVIEGSTLGGQVIARHLERTLGFADGRGYAFFSSYGSAVGPMWRAFRARLSRLSAEEEVVVQSALQTFELLHGWLCRETQAA